MVAPEFFYPKFLLIPPLSSLLEKDRRLCASGLLLLPSPLLFLSRLSPSLPYPTYPCQTTLVTPTSLAFSWPHSPFPSSLRPHYLLSLPSVPLNPSLFLFSRLRPVLRCVWALQQDPRQTPNHQRFQTRKRGYFHGSRDKRFMFADAADEGSWSEATKFP